MRETNDHFLSFLTKAFSEGRNFGGFSRERVEKPWIWFLFSVFYELVLCLYYSLGSISSLDEEVFPGALDGFMRLCNTTDFLSNVRLSNTPKKLWTRLPPPIESLSSACSSDVIASVLASVQCSAVGSARGEFRQEWWNSEKSRKKKATQDHKWSCLKRHQLYPNRFVIQCTWHRWKCCPYGTMSTLKKEPFSACEEPLINRWLRLGSSAKSACLISKWFKREKKINFVNKISNVGRPTLKKEITCLDCSCIGF